MFAILHHLYSVHLKPILTNHSINSKWCHVVFIHSSFVYFIRLFLCQPSPLGPNKGTLEIQPFCHLVPNSSGNLAGSTSTIFKVASSLWTIPPPPIFEYLGPQKDYSRSILAQSFPKYMRGKEIISYTLSLSLSLSPPYTYIDIYIYICMCVCVCNFIYYLYPPTFGPAVVPSDSSWAFERLSILKGQLLGSFAVPGDYSGIG